MKQVKTALFFLVFLFTTVITNAQTVEEIITKHVEATGGAEAWRKINTIRMEGTMTVRGADLTVALTTLHGKGFRQDITVMGMSGYQIITPAAGWNFMPFQGQTQVESMTAEDVKESQDELDATGDLVDYKEKGKTVELAGKDDVDGTECFKLLVTGKGGKLKTFFIDPKSYFVIRVIEKVKANGQELEQTTNYSGFKKIPEGIVIPMSVTLPFGELKVTKVEVNKPVDESIFKPTN